MRDNSQKFAVDSLQPDCPVWNRWQTRWLSARRFDIGGFKKKKWAMNLWWWLISRGACFLVGHRWEFFWFSSLLWLYVHITPYIDICFLVSSCQLSFFHIFSYSLDCIYTLNLILLYINYFHPIELSDDSQCTPHFLVRLPDYENKNTFNLQPHRISKYYHILCSLQHSTILRTSPSTTYGVKYSE